MSSIQHMLLGAGAGAKKIYVDDIFDNTVYTGVSGSGVQFTNGIDMAGEKGMVWVKSRTDAKSWYVFDNVANTAQGANPNHGLYLNNNAVTAVNNTAYQVTMNSNGVTSPTTDDNDLGGSGSEYYMPMFRQAKGFFDVVTYTGNGSNRTISHSLGSVPGMIIIKNTSSSENWRVYHKSIGAEKHVILNLTNAEADSATQFNDTEPTASVFSVGTDDAVNKNGDEFVAYLFAGGESTAATARSVDFDGDDNLQTAGDNSFKFGTGDWTIEGWYKWDSLTSPNGSQYLFDQRNIDNGHYAALYKDTDNTLKVYIDSSVRITGTTAVRADEWYHICLVRSSGVIKLYVNGVQEGSDYSNSSDFDGDRIFIAYSERVGTNYSFNGFISNFRVTKSAVYTSAFRTPTEPLTNITNTVLLCCNNASITGSTVTTGALSSSGDPTASTDSPFDDPAAFKFGDAGDQNVIKCGSYIGNGSSDGPEINLGWEPQWLFFKNSNAAENWRIYDSMRGWVTGGDDMTLLPNENIAEVTNQNFSSITPTGFKVVSSDAAINTNGDRIIYVAIRRPDGYVGKPPELGTDVFAMDTGNSSSTIPCFDSTFPVDFGLMREPAASSSWLTGARLTGNKRMFTNTNGNESSDSNVVFDSNVGYFKDLNSDRQAWAWKRHKGMEIIAFEGSGSARLIPHSMNAVPEFIILKNRETTGNQWYCYHKGLNGGTNPEDYYIKLGASGNASEAGDSNNYLFNSIAPTSTHFSVGISSAINESGKGSIAILFSSVNGISKVGSFIGNGTSQSISLGFQPRFLILKNATSTEKWYVLDTVRGWNSTSDAYLSLDTDYAQVSSNIFGEPTSTGFNISGSDNWNNANGETFLYYAHA